MLRSQASGRVRRADRWRRERCGPACAGRAAQRQSPAWSRASGGAQRRRLDL